MGAITQERKSANGREIRVSGDGVCSETRFQLSTCFQEQRCGGGNRCVARAQSAKYLAIMKRADLCELGVLERRCVSSPIEPPRLSEAV